MFALFVQLVSLNTQTPLAHTHTRTPINPHHNIEFFLLTFEFGPQIESEYITIISSLSRIEKPILERITKHIRERDFGMIYWR